MDIDALKDLFIDILTIFNGCCTVTQLKNKCQKVLGEQIKPQDYGFSEFKDLLRNFSDVISFRTVNGELWLEMTNFVCTSLIAQNYFENSFGQRSSVPAQQHSSNYAGCHGAVEATTTKRIAGVRANPQRCNVESFVQACQGSSGQQPYEYLSQYDKERQMQSSPSILSVCSEDFENDAFICSTPLPSDADDEEDTEKAEDLAFLLSKSDLSTEVVYQTLQDCESQIDERQTSSSASICNTQEDPREPSAERTAFEMPEDDRKTDETIEILFQNLNYGNEENSESERAETFTSESASFRRTFEHVPTEIVEVPTAPPPVIEDSDLLLFFPPVVQDPTVKLDAQPIYTGNIDVYIAEVFSLDHFWFHCGNDVTDVMEKLQADYAKLSSFVLAISAGNIKPGLLVACYHNEYAKWHRAMVIQPLDENGFARILFIDYGSVTMMHQKNIKYLFATYLSLPRLSFRGRLKDVKPPNSQLAWTDKQVKSFLNKVVDRKFKANVAHFEEKQQIYELELSFVRTNKTESLKDWLISKSIVEHLELKKSSVKSACFNFPTFERLESDHPTFAERIAMVKNGISCDLLLETNYLSCTSMKEIVSNPKLMRMMHIDSFKPALNYHTKSNEQPF